MPIISMFYGIIVYMFCERSTKHKKPHIHADYQGKRVVISLDGVVLSGKIPGKQLKMLLAWIVIHEEELKREWNLLSEGLDYFKIDPLR